MPNSKFQKRRRNRILVQPSTVDGPTKASFSQEKKLTGLLVTKQLDHALEECTSQVKEIARDCRSKNRKFRLVFTTTSVSSHNNSLISEISSSISRSTGKCVCMVSGPSALNRRTSSERPRYLTHLPSLLKGRIQVISFKANWATVGSCPLYRPCLLLKVLWRSFVLRWVSQPRVPFTRSLALAISARRTCWSVWIYLLPTQCMGCCHHWRVRTSFFLFKTIWQERI